MKQFHSLLTVILIFQVNLLVQGQTNPNASVDCSIEGLVTINITNVLNPEEWASNWRDEWKIDNSVNDSSCYPTNFNVATGTVSYKFNVSVCNTSVEEKGGDIVVTFMIDANVVGNSPTQSYDNAFNITCIYDGDGTVTEAFVPLHEVSENAQDSSELDYNMAVFVAGAQAPSDIPLGTEIEVRVSVDSSFQGTLDLLLKRCYTSYNGGLGVFNLISNSCPDNAQPDTMTNYNCTSQTDYTETFFFSAFRYASQPAGADITITCDVYVCLSTNDSSTCQTNCGQCSNIKTRDIGDEFTDMKVRVSAGPYRFVEDENEQKASNEGRQEEPGPSTGLIVGVSVVAVLAAIILCVVVILVLRRGERGITATSEIAQENPVCECERIATI